jgi:hypothetical protein
MSIQSPQPTVPVADNGAMALLSQIFANGGAMFGKGEETSKTTTDPANIQGLNPALMDQMVQGILQKAAINFGPNIANSLGAGNRALTDTTLASNQQLAMGTATAQAAQAQLQAITQQNQIMAQIALANKTTSTKTAASPLGKATSILGAAAAGYSLYDKIVNGDKKKVPPGSGTAAEQIINPSNPSDVFGSSGGNPAGTVDAVESAGVGGDLSNPLLGGDSALESFSLFNATPGVEVATDVASGAADLAGDTSLFEDIFGFSNPISDAISDIPIVGDVYQAVEDIPIVGDFLDFFDFGF